MTESTLKALVHTLRYEAAHVISVELRPVAGGEFPPFEPGAHIDLHLPNGLVRSYSLANSADERNRYVVGVLNDRASRGGSRFIHEQLRVGTVLEIGAPRNNFRLDEHAEHTVLVAGGIGITPLYCMLQRLVERGRSVELLYCSRTRSDAAFVEPVEALVGHGLSVQWLFDDERGCAPDLPTLLAGNGADTHYYCCGPTPMLDAFERACEQLGYANAHIERFTPVEIPPVAAGAASYTVVLERSQKTFEIQPGKSILDTLLDAGLEPEYSCKEGVCGACETRVLAGEVEHHDGILTKIERDSNQTMMICVSGCKKGPLVLDL